MDINKENSLYILFRKDMCDGKEAKFLILAGKNKYNKGNIRKGGIFLVKYLLFKIVCLLLVSKR